jgi:putative Holliday junction resolvase
MEIYRLMGIDFGEKRVGIALTDPMQIISKPFVVLPNDEKLFAAINDIIRKENVGQIVLGLPLNLSGEDSKKTIEVRAFRKKLEEQVKIQVVFYDERYSTAEATDLLIEMGYSPKERKKIIDKMAASIILKNYLEDRR